MNSNFLFFIFIYNTIFKEKSIDFYILLSYCVKFVFFTPDKILFFLFLCITLYHDVYFSIYPQDGAKYHINKSDRKELIMKPVVISGSIDLLFINIFHLPGVERCDHCITAAGLK